MDLLNAWNWCPTYLNNLIGVDCDKVSWTSVRFPTDKKLESLVNVFSNYIWKIIIIFIIINTNNNDTIKIIKKKPIYPDKNNYNKNKISL